MDAQVQAIIDKYEAEAECDEEGFLVHRDPSFHFQD